MPHTPWLAPVPPPNSLSRLQPRLMMHFSPQDLGDLSRRGKAHLLGTLEEKGWLE